GYQSPPLWRSARDFGRALRRGHLHGTAVGEDREVAEDDPFRSVDRRPGVVAGGIPLRGRDATTRDLDPVAVADPRLQLGPHRVAVRVRPAEGLAAAIDQRVDRQGPGAWA